LAERTYGQHPITRAPRSCDDRNHTYLDAADSDSRSAFLFHFPPNAAAFTGTLKLAGARYRKTNIEGYQLFYDVESAPGDGPRLEDLRDADIVAPTDRVVLTSDAPLVRDGTDRSIGLRADRISRIGNEAIVDGLHLDTDGLERRVAMLRDERGSNKAVLELHADTEVSGVVVEHREAASSFPRGLVARTSEDGVTWGASEVLRPHPTGLIWSGKGLMGASLTERMFLFARPHSTRFIELTAEPRHPSFPWIVRKASVLVRR
jgi:hypothetical protein